MQILNRCDTTFPYVLGIRLSIADMLNRGYLSDPGNDVRVMAMKLLLDVQDKTRQGVHAATGKRILVYKHCFKSLMKDSHAAMKFTFLNLSV